MKLKKQHMMRFDYWARVVFITSIFLFLICFLVVEPAIQDIEASNQILTSEIASLEEKNTVLMQANDELKNPTTTMSHTQGD